MKAAWEKLARRFDALKPRERLMVFLAGAVVIVWLGFASFIDSALVQQRQLAKSVEKHRTDLVQLQKQNAEMSRVLAGDPDAEGRRRIEDLGRRLSGYDTELRGVQQGLVAPNRMVRVLEDMLGRNARVRLVKLHTLPVSALVEPAAAAAPQNAGGTKAKPAGSLVYKHGIELTVEGSYLDLLDYQVKLERLPWRMFFSRTSLDSTGYPRVLMSVTLFTLSLEEAWLVV